MKTIAIIPARYGSTRFPAKPLALIAGKPMIQWTYESTCKCPDFEEVLVATDDERIRQAVVAFGGILEPFKRQLLRFKPLFRYCCIWIKITLFIGALVI